MKIKEIINEDLMGLGHLFDVAIHFKEYGASNALLANALLLAIFKAGRGALKMFRHILVMQRFKNMSKQEHVEWLKYQVQGVMEQVPPETKLELEEILRKLIFAIREDDEQAFNTYTDRLLEICKQNDIDVNSY